MSFFEIPHPPQNPGDADRLAPENGPQKEDYEILILQSMRRIIRAVDLHSRKLSFQHKVTAPQLVCLLFVSRNPGCTLSSVSKGVHLSPSTVVGILDRLEFKGWTQRTRDTRDRRTVRIQITSKGKKLLKKVPSPLQDRFAKVLKALPELEQATIALSLEKITQMMEADGLDASPILETGSVKSPPLQGNPPQVISLTQSSSEGLVTGAVAKNIVFEIPKPEDAKWVEPLVRAAPPLDPNSTYLYLILFEHFSDTCVVARSGSGDGVGFVTGYRLPEKTNTLFIWQVGVSQPFRGQGLGIRMLQQILKRPQNQNIQNIETTVNPSNQASRRMFEKFARDAGAPLTENLLFPKTLFGKGQHEDEVLFQIGPFRPFPVNSKE